VLLVAHPSYKLDQQHFFSRTGKTKTPVFNYLDSPYGKMV